MRNVVFVLVDRNNSTVSEEVKHDNNSTGGYGIVIQCVSVHLRMRKNGCDSYLMSTAFVGYNVLFSQKKNTLLLTLLVKYS